MAFHLRIDRDLNVPVTSQLRGQLEYGIALGDIERGARLPSVRELADQLGVAPVTVSQVYRELQEKGLLETQVGRGTFVRHDAPRPPRPDQQSHALDDLVHRLARAAQELGLSPGELAELIAVRLGRLEQGGPLRGLMVGNFPAATRRYAHAIAGHLRPRDRLDAEILPNLRASDAARRAARDADVVLTLAYREAEVRELLGGDVPVVTLAFLPSTSTRHALAELQPSFRVGLVSTYADYAVTFRRVVESYAPHVEVYRASVLGDMDVADVLGTCDVVIYGTGAEAILESLPPTARAFEFMFEPDARGLVRDLLPVLEALRPPRQAAPAERIPLR